jgi:uncharacterized protein
VSGQVVHFEIPADDVERASAFYQGAFGWQLQSMPDMGYTMISTTPSGPDGQPSEPGAVNGGMFARQDDITSPVVTIMVDDIDTALGKVEGLGGSVVRGRQQVGDMGFAAYFSDPEGNVLGLWQIAGG